jgi:hypothetical protein
MLKRSFPGVESRCHNCQSSLIQLRDQFSIACNFNIGRAVKPSNQNKDSELKVGREVKNPIQLASKQLFRGFLVSLGSSSSASHSPAPKSYRFCCSQWN